MNFTHFSKTVGNRARDPRRIIINRIGYGKNWPSQRKAALLRDSYSCVKCGHVGVKIGRAWDVHVDHIIKIKFFVCVETETCDFEAANALTNLQTLCKTCHRCKDGHQKLVGFIPL